ncbi:hypothetical protein RHGRI_007189 [Rhododendron griersonianum]|uniref:DUF7811 domain-containing protein n=1 Tax=Rhododendron griersonianum TaxID=479676 RepID=A0AAV6KW38_9ERIC|nr:hypothetical protein RHGRI_007189 [Rhododendron griersonianum]
MLSFTMSMFTIPLGAKLLIVTTSVFQLSGKELNTDSACYSSSSTTIQWVPEERVTLFTADGLVQIGGSMVPRRISSSDKNHGKSKTSQRFSRFQESDYMDPKQGLCLGALFDIAATNGLDMGRRLCIIGFCRSIEMLSDVVEDTVLEHGGEKSMELCSRLKDNLMFFTSTSASSAAEHRKDRMSLTRSCRIYWIFGLNITTGFQNLLNGVVAAEKATEGGLHEKLTMTVAVPLLWGVPPASERLRLAVRSGGGIVEKVFRQWHFL